MLLLSNNIKISMLSDSYFQLVRTNRQKRFSSITNKNMNSPSERIQHMNYQHYEQDSYFLSFNNGVYHTGTTTNLL